MVIVVNSSCRDNFTMKVFTLLYNTIYSHTYNHHILKHV
jgi:hypothetical protein